MQPWVRSFNYLQNYYDSVYKVYSTYYPAYPVVYYMVDWEASVYEKGTLDAGTYEKMGVGELSGLKYRKILFLPVYGIEQITPTNNAGERGVTMYDSEITQVVIPSDYNFKPCEWDIVHFIQDFVSPEQFENGPVFVVHNVNPATLGTMTHYQCKLKVAPFELEAVKDQLSGQYMFLEHTKKIHRIDTAFIMLRLQERSEAISLRLKDMFHDPTGFYLRQTP